MKSVAGARESPGVDVAALVEVVRGSQGDNIMTLVCCLRACAAVWDDTKLRLDPGDWALVPPGIAGQLAAEGKVEIMTKKKGDT